VTSGVGYLAGCLKNNATLDFDRVVGEAFIEPAQQRNIDGGLHAVRPFLAAYASYYNGFRTHLSLDLDKD
jgi:hypothetical protein